MITHKRRNLGIIVLMIFGLVVALAPTSSLVVQAQLDPGTLAQQLIRQAWVIGPTDLGFVPLRQELLARTGLSETALAAALQAGPHAPPLAVGSFTYWALLEAQGVDLRQVATRQVSYLVLGVLRGPHSTRLGSIPLPQTFGVVVFASSLAFALAVVDFSSGQVVAFVLLPVSPVLAASFSISDLLMIQVLVGVIQSTPTVPVFPGAVACPSLAVQFPFSVQVGSGLPLVTVTDSQGQMLFQISDGGLGVLRLSSAGPVLFSAMTTSAGATSIGFLFGAGSSTVRIPVGEPFRLVVTGGEKTACVQAIVYPLGFGAVLLGLAAHN